MIDRGPEKARFPDISSREVEDIVTQCTDLTLHVSPDQVVAAIYCASKADRVRFEHWVGLTLESIVTKDSTKKLDYLLSDNAASRECEGNWRHLNRRLQNGATIPLLLKYFQFGEAGRYTRLICARDLSPQLQIQKRLQEELMRLERDREALFSERKV